MTSDHERQVRSLFDEAVEMPPSEWQAFLKQSGASPDVQARVTELLEHHARADDFLEQPATSRFPLTASPFGGRLAEFRIVQELGRGGMGIVYLADDTALRRAVALKVFGPLNSSEQIAADRFHREAQAAARLSHPNIVTVHRSGRDGEYAFIAMEYVQGQTLRDHLASISASRAGSPEKPSDASYGKGFDPDLIRMIAEIAEALEHAHSQGVIHRDVKPSNILIDRTGKARITDFGIARITSEATLSTTAEIAGSYPYMSPEQLRVEATNVDHRSDVFSLGVILYEALTMKRPFDGPTPEAVLRAVLMIDPLNVRRINPKIPRDLATICHKAIEKDVSNRYQSAAHLGADLRAFLAGNPILAAPPGALRVLYTKLRAHRRWVVSSAIILLGLTSILSFMAFTSQSREKFAWMTISRPTDSAQFFLVRNGERGYPTDEDAKRLGSISPGTHYLQPGTYLLTAVRQRDHAFCEFDLVMLDAGHENQINILAINEDERYPAPFDRRYRVGVFRTTSELTSHMQLTSAPEFHLARSQSTSTLLSGVTRLPDFHVDRTEVSNREYQEFVKATGHSAPPIWIGGSFSSEMADKPVIFISREDAEAYARWRGKRLPSLIEWQAAARGPDGSLYPWGDDRSILPGEFEGGDVSTNLDDVLERYVGHVVSVDESAENQPERGLLNTFGNVREWTATVDLRDRTGYLAGRGWSDDPRRVTLANFAKAPLAYPSARTGFRCAKSAQPLGVPSP